MTLESPRQNRRALIIGIDRYPNLAREHQLEGCVSDAREVAALLRDRYGFSESQTTLLLDEQATRAGILAAMEDLKRQVRENDAVVVHFSGHGCQRPYPVDSRSHAGLLEETLVTHDSGHRDPLPNLDIPSAELRGWLKEMSEVTPYITLILDCCHSGTVATRTDRGKPRVRIRGLKPDLRTPGAEGRRKVRDVKDGPASFVRYSVLAACRERESAHEIEFGDGDDGSHGAFTWSLLKELRSLPDGACPTYLDVFEPVSSRMHDLYPLQQPQLEGVRDRELFGLAELIPLRFLPVQQRRSDRVFLGGGATCGLREGSVWTVHPPQAREGAEVLGRVQVLEVRGMASTAVVLDEVRPNAIGRWCRAVEETADDETGDPETPEDRYRHYLGIRNDSSRLRGKIEFNLAREREGRWIPVADGDEIEEGEMLSFGVVSRWDGPLHLQVLDFGLTGNIGLVYPPQGVSDPLRPFGTIEIGTMPADRIDLHLPEGAQDGGEEILKLFVTEMETDLSSLFQTRKRPVRGADSGAVGRARDTRSSFDPRRRGDEWITLERRFRLKRRSGRIPGRITRGGARETS